MSRRKYFKEHIDYLRKITPGRRNSEITEMFNEKFGMDATESAIRTLRQKNGILTTLPRVKTQYTEKHLTYLRKLSAQGLFNREITKKFNEKFGWNKTEAAIQGIRCKHGIRTTARHYWEKGHKPWNKGMKGITFAGSRPTQFKKGDRPPTWVPIGSERVTKDGYRQVKTRDVYLNGKQNWTGKHILVWEKHHGRKVPPGHVVIFGDGDRRNLDPENLICISRAQLAIMNKRRLIKDDARLTRTGALIADVVRKAGERKEGAKKMRKDRDLNEVLVDADMARVLKQENKVLRAERAQLREENERLQTECKAYRQLVDRFQEDETNRRVIEQAKRRQTAP